MNSQALARFEAKITRDGECWLWTGAVDKDGYGWFKDGTAKRAHRVSYEHHVGAIPASLTLDHLCRTPGCVNPAHLEPVTRGENVRRGDGGHPAHNARKTHCKRGHEFTPGNTLVRSDNGWRQCRECMRITDAQRYARKRAGR